MVLITKSKMKMKTIKNKQIIESGTKRKANDNEDLDTSLAENHYSGNTKKSKGTELGKGKRAKLLKKKKSVEINQSESADQLSDMVTSANDGPFDISKIRDIHYHVDDKHTAKRSLYLKGDAANSESIIVFNIPPFISADGVKKILDHTVAADYDLKEVVIKRSMIKGEDMNETYRVASAVMSSEEDVETVLRNCDDHKNVICLSSIGVGPLPTGITKYVAEYKKSVVSAEELEKDVNEFFEVHDKKMREEKQRAKKMRNVPDEDGWITVTKSKFKPTPQAVVVKNTDDLLKLAKNKKKVKDNLPFYTFQLKQSKVKHLQELREKFEEDKKKLAMAKAARKFRPT